MDEIPFEPSGPFDLENLLPNSKGAKICWLSTTSGEESGLIQDYTEIVLVYGNYFSRESLNIAIILKEQFCHDGLSIGEGDEIYPIKLSSILPGMGPAFVQKTSANAAFSAVNDRPRYESRKLLRRNRCHLGYPEIRFLQLIFRSTTP
jgi:hypothetical protein